MSQKLRTRQRETQGISVRKSVKQADVDPFRSIREKLRYGRFKMGLLPCSS